MTVRPNDTAYDPVIKITSRINPVETPVTNRTGFTDSERRVVSKFEFEQVRGRAFARWLVWWWDVSVH
jgi:hypothetical protein